MRPVIRGAEPSWSTGPGGLTDYSKARQPLEERLGTYCSYCEMPCSEGPDVEHVRPKSLHPSLAREWENLLLACCFCNAVKGDRDLGLDQALWPDRDNTFRALVYERDRAPKPRISLPEDIQELARSTVTLFGLDREPNHPRLTSNDRRWKNRREAWSKAERARVHLQRQPTDEMRRQIVDTATSTGFWSVWLTVFKDDKEMVARLLDSHTFPGTWGDCLDPFGQARPREGGLC